LDRPVTTPSAPSPLRTDRLERLAAARLYLCTDGRRERGDLPEFLDAVLGAGVDIVLLEVFADACARHGKLVAVNDRADVAHAAAADVLHLGQRDLPPAAARALVGPDVIIGRSSHSTGQAAAAAAEPDSDYFCVGPVWPTPTKPGRPAAGLPAVAEVASGRPTRPWFAIGGIDEQTLDDVLDAGARRVVVVRVITEADDPAAATRRLADRLAARPW
jgi:thiamine-phosphate pyrophosphorylase